MTKFLHTMIRVTDPDATIAFFKLIGLEEVRRYESEQGRFTLIFLAANEDESAAKATRAGAKVYIAGAAPQVADTLIACGLGADLVTYAPDLAQARRLARSQMDAASLA